MSENTDLSSLSDLSSLFSVSALLRNPVEVVERARSTGQFWLLVAFLAAITLAGSGIFGFALGAFVNLKVAVLDAVKMAGVAAFAFALCFPTFYVFVCIGGSRMGAFQLLAFGLVCTATIGCLLAALAPVMWLFAVSTKAAGVVVISAAVLALAAFRSGFCPISRAAMKGMVDSTVGLKLWMMIFFLVALQSVTFVRPMLSEKSDWWRLEEGKLFFVGHFMKTLAVEF